MSSSRLPKELAALRRWKLKRAKAHGLGRRRRQRRDASPASGWRLQDVARRRKIEFARIERLGQVIIRANFQTTVIRSAWPRQRAVSMSTGLATASAVPRSHAWQNQSRSRRASSHRAIAVRRKRRCARCARSALFGVAGRCDAVAALAPEKRGRAGHAEASGHHPPPAHARRFHQAAGCRRWARSRHADLGMPRCPWLSRIEWLRCRLV